MKAVILAGGEGARLRPLSCGTPKPMTRLFDRPIMEHTLNLLRKNGITDIAVTLCYMPHVFEEYFGDGSRWGVSLRYYYETTPLGTAGGTAACRDFLDGDFLVISGDAVCDFDFAPLFAFHRQSHAEVTVVLSRQSNPLGYGLVLTGQGGRVSRFIEKPSWDSVFTDTANTGIYILSPAVLQQVPPGKKVDFAHDLFPRLLAEGRAVCAVAADGYWCDVGNSGAYLTCVRDALAGRVRLELPPAERGIRALSPIPADAVVSPPVYIGENVTIGEGAHIGPYTVLGEGTRVGRDARVTGSAANGAVIGSNARLRDSIVCRGAEIGAGAVLQDGCVVGEKAVIGVGARLHAGVLVWPEKACAADADVRFKIPSRSPCEPPAFWDGSAVSGEPDGMLTPEFCTSLGIAAAMTCGQAARIGIGCENVPACGMLASALECGIRAGGARAVRCGGSFAAAAAFASRYASFGLCFFVYCSGEQITVRLFDADGLPPEREHIRKIELTLRQGDFSRAPFGKTGRVMKLSGLMDVYCRSATSHGDARGRSYAVRASAASPALCNTLWLMGARIAPRGEGRAVFEPSADGLSLRITDETGHLLDDGQTMACAAYAALESGGELAVPFEAPAVFDTMAEGFGKRVYRVGRDGIPARQLWAAQTFLRDGVHRAAYLAAYTAARGMPIAELAEKVPHFHTEAREIPLASDRARFMRVLSDSFDRSRPEYGHGMRVHIDGGWITIAPSARSCAIRICAESSAAELAHELCEGVCERVRQLDSDIKRRKTV